jgi:hypothetical protein
MLAKLRKIAEKESALLCYLIEMAYVDAGDLQAGARSFSVQHCNRN